MKPIAFFAIFCGLFLTAAPVFSGQTGGTQQQQRMEQFQQRLEAARQRLQLTPDQVEQVRPIFRDEIQQLKAVRDKYAGDQNRRSRRRMAREARSIQHATEEKLKKILSKKQMDEYKKMREERKQDFRARRSAGR